MQVFIKKGAKNESARRDKKRVTKRGVWKY
jgi:hypothetical protein